MPRKATFGTIISGTMQSRDLLPAFIVKFESLSGEAFAEQETVDALLLCEQEDWLNDAGQATLSEITNNLVDSLDALWLFRRASGRRRGLWFLAARRLAADGHG